MTTVTMRAKATVTMRAKATATTMRATVTTAVTMRGESDGDDEGEKRR